MIGGAPAPSPVDPPRHDANSAARDAPSQSSGEAKLLAVVPIRAGSQGLPGKNTRLLNGVPLYRHAIEQALSGGAEAVIVTTDIEDVLDGEHGPNVIVHRRPDHLRGDDVAMSPVLVDALDRPEFDDSVVVLLQATSPLRRPDDVHAAVDQFRAGTSDMVMSVCETDRSVLKYGTIDGTRFLPLRSAVDVFSNRQALPSVYRPNGAIYVFASEWFRSRGDLYTDDISAFEMSTYDSIDIDSEADFDICARRLAEREGAGTHAHR